MWISPGVVINKLIDLASQLMFLGGLCFTFHKVYLLWSIYMLGRMSLPGIPVHEIFSNIDVISNPISFGYVKTVSVSWSASDLGEAVKETDLFRK